MCLTSCPFGELLLEVRAAAATAVRDLVAAEMIGVTKLRVPLRVKTCSGITLWFKNL